MPNTHNAIGFVACLPQAVQESLKPCIADPKTQELVRQSMAEGKSLDVTSTPTSFVDGRRLVGSDQALLEQYIQFDSRH